MRAALLILLALTLHTFAAPSHWAYTAPERPALPKTDSDWPRNPIDYFILAKQKDNQLAPSPTASPGQLLRRVHLDLTGLPPTPDVVAQFLENPSDTAYEKIVDDLLYSNTTANGGHARGSTSPDTQIATDSRPTNYGIAGPIATG